MQLLRHWNNFHTGIDFLHYISAAHGFGSPDARPPGLKTYNTVVYLKILFKFRGI